MKDLLIGTVLTATVMVGSVLSDRAAQTESGSTGNVWQLVIEHVDGNSDIIDHDLTLSDCLDAAQIAIVTYPAAPVIYCETLKD